MKVIKDYHEKNRQELLQSLKKNKMMTIIHAFAGLLLFIGGYFSLTMVSWRIGEFALIGSVVIFIMTAIDMMEHVMLNILLAKKEK